MCEKYNPKKYINKFFKRASVLCCRNCKAILSIEASVVLPTFLIAITLLLLLSSVFYINEKISNAVNEEAKECALNSFNGDTFGVGAIQAEITERLGEGFLSSGIIKNGKYGLDFSDTDISNREIIEIAVNYTIVFPFDIFGFFELDFDQRVILHSWIGYIQGLSSPEDYEYVYMTNTGSVYHRNKNCSHIKLQIENVIGSEIRNLRNSSGAKYKPCVFCHPSTSDLKLYVTSDGDRYHNTLSCSGLRRTIRRVKLLDIRGVPPCSRCGY